MIRPSLNRLQRILLSVSALVILLCSLIAALLFTNTGLNLVLWGAQQALPQLSIERAEGAIFPRFTLINSGFHDDSLSVDLKLKELTLAVSPVCLISSSVCVEQLWLNGVDFRLPELATKAEPSEQESSDSAKSIQLPVPVQINNVELNNISLDVLGNKIHWEDFSTSIGMSGNALTIYKTELNNIDIELASSGIDTAEKQNDKTQNSSSAKLPDVMIPLKIDLKRFDLKGFTLKGDTPMVVNHLGLQARADQHDIRVESLELDIPQADLKLASELTLTGGYPLSLTAEARVKDTQLKGQKINLTAGGSLESLTLDADFSGPVKAGLQGSLKALEADLPFDFAVTKGDLQWPMTGESDYKAGIDALQIKGSLTQYQLELDADLSGREIPDVQLLVSGQGTSEQIKLEKVALETLGGEISGSVVANWASQVNWQAALGLSDIQPGLQWKDAQGKVSGSLTTSGELLATGGWRVDLPSLDIEGIIRKYPINIQGNLKAVDYNGEGEIHLDTQGLAIKHGANGIFVQGNLDKEWNIDVRIDAPDIGKSVPDLPGKLTGNLNIRGELKTPNIKTNLKAENLAYQELGKVSLAELTADITPLPRPGGDLKLSVEKAEIQGQVIDSVDLSFSGNQQQHDVSLNLFSDLINGALYITGSLKDKPSLTWQGSLDKADFETKQGIWSAESPVNLTFLFEQQIAKIQAHCWSQESASVCLTKDTQIGQSGEADLEVKKFNFKQIAMFIPKELSLKGQVNAVGHAKWSSGSSPDVSVTIQMPEGKVVQNSDKLELAWDTVALSARLKNDRLKADWLIDLTGNGQVSGNADIPDVLSAQKSLDARLKVEELTLDMLQPILGEYSELEAQIDSELSISGPLLHPALYGGLSVQDMKVLGDITPLEVNQGNISLLFNGYDAVLDADIESTDGLLKVDGNAGWRDIKAWHANARIHSDELNVSMPPMVKVKVKPQMAISVTPELAKINGDIYLPWGRINVEELPPSAVSVSSDEIILNRNLQPVEEGGGLPMVLESDVNIHVGDDFKLSAFGLKGGLKGLLNVTQKDQGPFIVGEINIQDGTYRSFGQDLIIKEGKILMNGPADQPYLQITAIRNPDNTQDDVTAGIKVSGPANEPVIDIYSEPTMPQQNALSYLLRGQDIDGESGGSTMTTALIGLSLAKSGRIVGEIGEAFGVSDLQLDTAGSGDESQVTVSGYILPGLQVKYGVGIFDSFGEFTVRYRLMQDLYLEAVSGMNSAVDLLYQFEFD